MSLSLNTSQEKIFKENMQYVQKIVNSEFGKSFQQTHMVDKDDLEQLGYIGLIKGVKTYDDSEETKLSTHLYNHIKWSIQKGMREHSLRRVNRSDKSVDDRQAVNLTSLDQPLELDESNNISLIDTLESEEEQAIIHFEKLAEIHKHLPKIVKGLISGLSHKDIATELDIHPVTVSRLVKQSRKQIEELVVFH